MVSRSALVKNRIGLVALSIASYGLLCGNRSNCDDQRAPTIACMDAPITVAPGTCTAFSNPCADGQWLGAPRFDGFRLCDGPNGVTVNTRRVGNAITREVCVSANAPLLVNEDVEFVYGRGLSYGTASLVVTTATPMVVNATASPTTIIAGETSQLVANVSGGVPPYFYAWVPTSTLDDNDIAAPIASPTVTTQYTVGVTDSAGQQVSASVSVHVTAELTVTANPPVVDAGDPSQLEALAVGGTPPYTFVWVPAETLDDAGRADPIARPSNTTTYNVTMTDSNGVALNGSVQVRVNLAATVSANPETVNEGEQSQLTSTVVGGLPPYVYAWTPAATLDDATIANPIATPNASTTYDVTITDSEGFQTNASVTVDLVAASDPPPTAFFTFNVVCCPTLNLDATGSTGNIVSYTWDLAWTVANPDRITASPTTSFSIQEFNRGVITLTVTAADGQTATFSRNF